MKYIRTKDGIYNAIKEFKIGDMIGVPYNGLVKIIAQADTIEELCDVLIIKTKEYRGFKGEIKTVDLRIFIGTKEDLHNYLVSQMKREDLFEFAFLGIETDKGLIYVAKINTNGELELL